MSSKNPISLTALAQSGLVILFCLSTTLHAQAPLAALVQGDSIAILSVAGDTLSQHKAKAIRYYQGGHTLLRLWSDADSTYADTWIDSTGATAFRLDPQYIGAHYSEGRVCYYNPLSSTYGYLDQAGEEVIAAIYAEAGPFQNGLARVARVIGSDTLIFFLNEKGKVKLKPKFRRVQDFYEGMAAVQHDNGLWGYIDLKAKPVIRPQFLQVGYFYQGIAPACDSSGCGLIDMLGDWVIPPKYQGIGPFSDGRAPVLTKGKWGFVDRSGVIIISPVYDEVRSFFHQRAAVRVGEDWGYIDPSGRTVITPDYRLLPEPYHLGVVWDGKGGYMDKEGDNAFEMPDFEDIIDLHCPADYPQHCPQLPILTIKE